MSELNKRASIDSQPLVSVIVPVYNVERFIRRCVDSILSQTYKNLEIILIDDGSPDNSGTICDEYAQMDSRIRVIHQENGGVSIARNAGLRIITGEYIAFVDPDDYIDVNMYETMIKKIVDTNSDICVCQWQYELSDGRQVVDLNKIDKSIYGEITSVKFAEYYYRGSYEEVTVCALWNKLYKRDIFNDLYFYGNISEDYRIQDAILCKSYKLVVIPDQLYFYVQNENSLTNKPFSTDVLLTLDIFLDRINYFADNEFILWNTRKRYCDLYVEYYYKAKNANIEMRHIRDFSKVLKSLLFDRHMKLKFILRMILFRISPKLYERLSKK